MKIIEAEEMGMCFGVRDALSLLRSVKNPRDVTVHGELVHNSVVLNEISARGFASQPEQDRNLIPATGTVLITAHGVSDRVRERFLQNGKQILDSTCPLVERAHQAGIRLRDEGRFVVIIGKPGHVEVEGLTGDLERFAVVAGKDDIRTWDEPSIGVLSQTTVPPQKAAELLDQIRSANPDADVKWADTICKPTKDRQKALERLIDQITVLVVVGGANSNNTRQLLLTANAQGVPGYHIASADELRPEWFSTEDVVGLSAGTSTLDTTISEVRDRLKKISRTKTRSRVAV